jgi:hypothetical protein
MPNLPGSHPDRRLDHRLTGLGQIIVRAAESWRPRLILLTQDSQPGIRPRRTASHALRA